MYKIQLELHFLLNLTFMEFMVLIPTIHNFLWQCGSKGLPLNRSLTIRASRSGEPRSLCKSQESLTSIPPTITVQAAPKWLNTNPTLSSEPIKTKPNNQSSFESQTLTFQPRASGERGRSAFATASGRPKHTITFQLVSKQRIEYI